MTDSATDRQPLLSSPQNQRVKDYVELRDDGNVRREKQRFLLEGRRAVSAALSLPHVLVHELIVCERLLGGDVSLVQAAREKNIPLVRVSQDVFKKIAGVQTPQGLAAVVRVPVWNAEEILARADGVFVVACGVQDPGNVGTLIRSCEAAGAAALVTLERTADPFNAKVVRATAAGLLALPILRMKSGEFLAAAAKHKLRLIATVARGGETHRAFDWQRRPIALCIGSEGEGLPAEIAAACREHVTIPMRGQAESLNAAVAASILLFQALG
jgi:RNA methyltransferase, TrmH family